MRPLALSLLLACPSGTATPEIIPLADAFGQRCDFALGHDTCPGKWVCRENPDDYPWGYCTLECSTSEDCPDCMYDDSLLSPCARCEAGFCGTLPFPDK